MKEYTSDKIRNVAVLSHDGAGKTAVVESLLLACGAVDAVGVGKDNKHIMDYEPEEIKRNVTIQLGIAPCEWEGYKLNFLDTPGYSEFCGEVRAALRASDGILLVVSAESGVEMDTERAWDYGVELKLPRMVYVNKMDAEHADFFGCLEKLRAVFGKSIMPLQIPIGEGTDFRGIIDVCKGLSLNDSFWVTPSDFTGSFADYNLYENPFSEVLSIVAYTGYGSSDKAFTTSPELTTDGMLPKAWRRRSRRAMCRSCCAASASYRSTWPGCWQVQNTAANLKSA